MNTTKVVLFSFCKSEFDFLSLTKARIMLKYLFAIIICFIYLPASSQMGYDTITATKVSPQYLEEIKRKATILQKDFDKKTQRVLIRMQKQEVNLQKKLAKIDSIAANNIFSNTAEKYNQIQEKLKNPGNLSRYIPKLDTLTTSLKFFDQHPEWMGNIKDAKQKIVDANDKLKELQSKVKCAEDIKIFLKERKQFLKEQLEKFGFAKELKKINKEVYYYSQQINEYREIFKDSKKAEKKVLELLSKTKLFQDFMKKNGMLASLFRMPGDMNDPRFQASLSGLQTRTQVNSLIQNQVAAAGSNGRQAISQNIQQARSQLEQLKNKIGNVGGSSDDDLPDFKPNGQKTKSFAQRLEYGMNLQTQKAQYYFPRTTDIGLSIGYKLNDKSVIGIGASYKLGFGSEWRNIHFSQQGAGLRSYMDWKLKGSIWVSGGMEMNYMKLFSSIDQLRDYDAWQKSGLIGISKKYQVSKKVKGKMQLLWDFLSYEQLPRTQPIVFRFGFNF